MLLKSFFVLFEYFIPIQSFVFSQEVEPDTTGKLSLENFTVLMANKMSEKDTKEEILKVSIRVWLDIRFGRIFGHFQYPAGYRILRLSGYRITD